MDGEIIVALFVGVLMVGLIGIVSIDGIYKHPQAAENANQICQKQGYDFYETFSRVGILSTKPVAIKCQYVSSYSEQDLNINGKIPVAVNNEVV